MRDREVEVGREGGTMGEGITYCEGEKIETYSLLYVTC